MVSFKFFPEVLKNFPTDKKSPHKFLKCSVSTNRLTDGDSGSLCGKDRSFMTLKDPSPFTTLPPRLDLNNPLFLLTYLFVKGTKYMVGHFILWTLLRSFSLATRADLWLGGVNHSLVPRRCCGIHWSKPTHRPSAILVLSSDYRLNLSTRVSQLGMSISDIGFSPAQRGLCSWPELRNGVTFGRGRAWYASASAAAGTFTGMFLTTISGGFLSQHIWPRLWWKSGTSWYSSSKTV